MTRNLVNCSRRSQRNIPTGPSIANASIEIPADILESARLSPDQLKLELALSLYAQRRLSIGKARELAGLSLWEFRQILGARRIEPHYDSAELAEDLAAIDALTNAEQ